MVPWFDEIYYADGAWTFLTQGKFSIPVYYPQGTGGALHAPLFFVIQAGVLKLFGMGIWQIRLLPLLSGLAVFLIFARLVFKTTRSDKYTFLFMLLFISDRAINFDLHSGRMDMLAVLFVLLSILLFERMLKWKGMALPIVGAVLAGLLLSAGFLIALRIAVATVPCVLLLFLYRSERQSLYYYMLIIYGITAALPVMAWLWFAYGGVAGASNVDGFSSHFGLLSSLVGNVFRRVYEIPKMLLFYGTIIYLFCMHRDVIRRNFFFSMFTLITLGFVLFVIERGPYRAMFFPFVYFSILVSIHLIKHPPVKKLAIVALTGVLGINVLLSMPRLVYLVVNWPAIQQDKVAEQIYKEIPQGSRVITDFRFYYILMKNKCDVLIPNKNVFTSIEYAEKDFDPEYILGNTVPLPELAKRKKLKKTVGILPPPLHPMLEKFVYLEAQMLGNNFHAPLLEIVRND